MKTTQYLYKQIIINACTHISSPDKAIHTGSNTCPPIIALFSVLTNVCSQRNS